MTNFRIEHSIWSLLDSFEQPPVALIIIRVQTFKIPGDRIQLDLFEEASVMTSPATAIKTEIREIIYLQIQVSASRVLESKIFGFFISPEGKASGRVPLSLVGECNLSRANVNYGSSKSRA